MKNKFIVANLKAGMSVEMTSAYLQEMNRIHYDRLILCPSSIYIPYFLKQGYQVGLQNVGENMTGEITPKQAYDMGISHVIIGHSDRRIHLHETDEEIHQKLESSIEAGLRVILCIGETREEREMLRTDRVLKKQIHMALHGLQNLDQVMIAYEPVWAIGTSVLPSIKDIEGAVHYIKEVVLKETGEEISVLYGGSLTPRNVASIMNIDSLDGIIVGRSATDRSMFLKLLEVAVNL